MNVAKIPGNVLAGNWRVAMLVSDERHRRAARGDRRRLLRQARRAARRPGGPRRRGGRGPARADQARDRATARDAVVEGIVGAEMAPYTGPDGSTTTLQNSIFSTVPGSPAYVGKASRYAVDLPEHGMQWAYEGRNAIQADYRMTHAGMTLGTGAATQDPARRPGRDRSRLGGRRSRPRRAGPPRRCTMTACSRAACRIGPPSSSSSSRGS